MRPVRTITAFTIGAAMAVAGCTAHSNSIQSDAGISDQFPRSC
jgi:hypothetical protein